MVTSVILQSIFDVSIPRVVKKECFTPAPKIDSALCLLIPNNKFNIENFNRFKDFVHAAFSMRRKTLMNNLKHLYSKESILKNLQTLNLSESVRPEEVSVENFVKLHKLFEKVE